MAPQDDREVHAHPMGVVCDEEPELRRDPDFAVQRLHVDLLRPPGRVEPGDELVLLREPVQAQHEVSATLEHVGDGTLPRARSPGEGDEHAAHNLAGLY